MSGFHIRWMIRRDMPEVMQIEQSTHGSWVEEEFTAALKKRNYIGMVAELGDTVVGYVIYRFEKRRLVLVRLAVHPTYRRVGVGTLLVDKVLSKLTVSQRQLLWISVPELALDVQCLLRANGVKCRRIEDDQYVFWIHKQETGSFLKPAEAGSNS